MENFECPKCGSKNVHFDGNLFIRASMSMWGNLTKRNIRKKEFNIQGFNWSHANIYCMDCWFYLRQGKRNHIDNLQTQVNESEKLIDILQSEISQLKQQIKRCEIERLDSL